MICDWRISIRFVRFSVSRFVAQYMIVMIIDDGEKRIC